MIELAIKRLKFLCEAIPELLGKLDEDILSAKPNKDKWSKKEIIGHLIDSATNNHQRFVRAQFEDCPAILYDQNNWNKYSFYQQINSKQLISFWLAYNYQLIELASQISLDNLQRSCLVGERLLTLDFLINDYVQHVEHHLQQIVSY